MRHQNARKKLNLKPSHRRALIRNQAIHVINHGRLRSTKARIREVKRFVERLVTLARVGNTFNARRRVKALMPYSEEAILKLFKEIAPKYVNRPGGYMRVINLGRRTSDTADVAMLEWV